MLSPPSLTTWLDSPDGTLWHPRAQIYGKDVRLILSTLVGSLLVWLAMTILSLLESRRKESSVHAHHPTPPQIQPGWEGKCLESTELLDPRDTLGLQIRCFDASTGWHLATLEADTRQTIDDKLAAASEAAKKWEGSEWSARRRLLRSILAWIVEDQEKIVRVACRDTGKAVRTTARGARSRSVANQTCFSFPLPRTPRTTRRPSTPTLGRSSPRRPNCTTSSRMPKRSYVPRLVPTATFS